VPCRTEDEVVAAVRDVLGRSSPVADDELSVPPDQARQLVGNFDAESFPRVETLLSEVEESVGRGRVGQGYRRRDFLAGEAVHRAVDRARRAARSLFPERLRRHRAYSQIFYGFDRDVLERKLRAVQRVVGKRVHWTYYGPDLFSIESGAS
jgi:hypothetical protein